MTQVDGTLISPAECPIQVEDDRTGMSVATLKRAFLDNLFYLQGIDRSQASLYDYYMALAFTIRDRLLHRFLKTVATYKQEEVKVVCYLSAEFLMGRHLGNNLINLGLYDKIDEVMTEFGLDLDEIIEQESNSLNIEFAERVETSGDEYSWIGIQCLIYQKMYL
jgi:starch phosphorylase